MCLDDTGSSYVSIFAQDDVPLLGIDAVYNYHLPPELVATANGNVYCQKLLLELQVIAFDGNPMGISTIQECLIVQGHSGTGTRLSGPKLRMTLFIGTAPDNPSRLHAAVRKNGLMGKLPVV